MSCIPPKPYAERFLKYMDKIIEFDHAMDAKTTSDVKFTFAKAEETNENTIVDVR